MTAITINDLAQELLDAVIDEVGAFIDAKATPSERSLGTQTLKSCSLVAKTWSPRSRSYLFYEVGFTSADLFSRWQTDISRGENSPYSFVRTLHFREKTDQWITPETFSHILPHLVAFPRLENLIFTQDDITPLVLPLQQAPPSFLESVRHLEVDSTAMSTPRELFTLIDCFPHLEDLNLGHGRVRRHHERQAYPEKAAERFRGRLYIKNPDDEGDDFLRELSTRPVQFQEVRIIEGLFHRSLGDLIAACAPALRRLQILAPSRDSGLPFGQNQGSLPEPSSTDRPLIDLSQCVRLQHLRLSTRDLDALDGWIWIMPILHTITKIPEELTLHEASIFQPYGGESLRDDAWRGLDVCLEALAIKAMEQDHELKFVLTMGMFSARSGSEFWPRLPSFIKKGTFVALHTQPTYSHTRGPF